MIVTHVLNRGPKNPSFRSTIIAERMFEEVKFGELRSAIFHSTESLLPDSSKLTLTLGQLNPPREPQPALSSKLTAHSSSRSYSARFVRAGRVRQSDGKPSGIEILPEALSRAVEKGMFDGKAVFIDHAGFFDNPSLRDLVGDTRNSIFTGDAVEGVIEFYNTSDGQTISNLLDEILDQGQDAPDVGLSIVFYPVWRIEPIDRSGQSVRSIVDIRHVESVDLVFGPAADGRLLQALSSHSLSSPLPELLNITHKVIREGQG